MADINIEKAVAAIVEAKIRESVASALNKDTGALVESIVELALTEKRHSYDQATIFQTHVNKKIREAAHDAMVEWLDEQRPAIRDAVRKRLSKNGAKLITELADKLAVATTELRIKAQFSSEDW